MTKTRIIDGNEATARIAHKVSETIAIYPITPSTPMGELADQLSANGEKNIFGSVPEVVEMQSEGGASGTLHGALQTGSLATTFTASQGLLLMIPNMYKIAGELNPAVIHVASRSVATHALSIFGDHSDVMAVRPTGFAMLCSSSPQEAHDLAMIVHAATLEARVPFVHFFDGFRTSHELNTVTMIPDDVIRAMIDEELVFAHRERALSPDHPFIRGTAQNPDVFFQGRETVNPYYNAVPKIVANYMERFAKLTGRSYNTVEYHGVKDAENIIIAMGSGTETIIETTDSLQQLGEKVGLLRIRLFRPFPKSDFLACLPSTCKKIAVLDRTKEPGALGEPLYQDVVTAISEAFAAGELKLKSFPTITGGRYGLSSKEFNPAMVKGIFDELKKDQPKAKFTVGINDDVTKTSIDYDPDFDIEPDEVTRAVFYGLGSDGTVGANKNSIKIIGESTDNYAQGYFVYDSKKAGSITISHLRFGPKPIRFTYLIKSANFVSCHQFNFIHKMDILDRAKDGASFLLNSPYSSEEVWQYLPAKLQQQIIDKAIKFYVIDAYTVAKELGLGHRINTVMQACFFWISDIMPHEDAIAKMKEAIEKTYGRKGHDVVEQNCAAVDGAVKNLHEVKVPQSVTAQDTEIISTITDKAPDFVRTVTAKMLSYHGDDLPVSAFPVDGTFPSGTTKWEKRNLAEEIAVWEQDLCIQCGRCSMVCPHGVIRCKSYDTNELQSAPEHFKHAKLSGKGFPNQEFTLQVYLEDCTGCNLCHEACPVRVKDNDKMRAINLGKRRPILEQERQNIEFFEKIHGNNSDKINTEVVRGIQFLTPLFEFSGACAGCGETPYLSVLTQLFGDRMLIANATGCSSIYGGNLPTTPWTTNDEGRGPAWSNSLFEDNAEFGLGFRLSEDKHTETAASLLESIKQDVDSELADAILQNTDNREDLAEQRTRISTLKESLKSIDSPEARHLASLADYLAYHSVWIVGGDGWAYDIGFGGLDHVLASGKNVNVLVLNTQTYSNTGGQASKATPKAAVAKFAAAGKRVASKNLAKIAMSYGYIYVAKISVFANPRQTLKAFQEAESYNGPSLIIAYSHCVSHGLNLSKGIKQQTLAVETGFWPLFRYNPERAAEGLKPMQIDSRAPSKPFREFAVNERRFKILMEQNPEESERLIAAAQEDIDKNWQFYRDLAE